MYNNGKSSVNMIRDGESTRLAPGDSAVVKPFKTVQYSSIGDMATMVVAKVPGCMNKEVMHECTLFASEGLQRMSTETSKWW